MRRRAAGGDGKGVRWRRGAKARKRRRGRHPEWAVDAERVRRSAQAHRVLDAERVTNEHTPPNSDGLAADWAAAAHVARLPRHVLNLTALRSRPPPAGVTDAEWACACVAAESLALTRLHAPRLAFATPASWREDELRRLGTQREHCVAVGVDRLAALRGGAVANLRGSLWPRDRRRIPESIGSSAVLLTTAVGRVVGRGREEILLACRRGPPNQIAGRGW